MMIKESQILIPAAFCIPMQTRGAAARLLLFFLGSSGCHRNTSRCLLLYVVSAGTDVLYEWTATRYPARRAKKLFHMQITFLFTTNLSQSIKILT